MKYSIRDIDVFVMTHNRSAFLKETLDCLLVQTVLPDRITVFDNESTDDTESVVRGYADRGVMYVRTTGKDGNFYEMQKRAKRPYVVHFHDDNLYHREYLERVLFALNTFDNVGGVTGAYTYFEYSGDPNYVLRYGPKLMSQYLVLKDKPDFVVHKIRSETRPQDLIVDNIGALVYKTKYFRSRVSMNWKYGKADDTDLSLRVLDYGKFVTISDRRSVFVRQHPNRDVNTDENSLSLEQAINWVKLYLDNITNVVDETFWLDFLGMVYTQYPYFIKRKIFSKVQTMAFFDMLCEKAILPPDGVKAFHKFKSGKAVFVSGGALITQANAPVEDVRRVMTVSRGLPVRIVRKILKYFMPYAIVRLVQRMQDRALLGR